MTDFTPLFSRCARAMVPSPIRRMAGLVSQPDVISFAGGMPSPATFPEQDLRQIMDEVVGKDGARVFQYGVTRGLDELREMILEILAGRGVKTSKDGLMVTSGSQQGLELLSRILLDPGDVVLVELPSYIGALACFRNSLAEMVGIRQDDAGIVTADLEDKIKQLRRQGKRVKFLYLIPNFQNPSGITISPQRRQEALELARASGFLIIEDDPYGELYFQDVAISSLRPIKAREGGADVVYLGSFSKVVSPGLRTAYIAAPPGVIAQVELAKQAADLCTSSLDQYLVYEYCRRGLYQKHLAEVRTFYERKCRAMLDALAAYMPAGVNWTRPQGGMFVWVTLPPGLDAEALAMEAVQRFKVAFIQGAPFFVDGTGQNTLRLTFAKENEEKIAKGIQILGDFFREKIATG